MNEVNNLFLLSSLLWMSLWYDIWAAFALLAKLFSNHKNWHQIRSLQFILLTGLLTVINFRLLPYLLVLLIPAVVLWWLFKKKLAKFKELEFTFFSVLTQQLMLFTLLTILKLQTPNYFLYFVAYFSLGHFLVIFFPMISWRGRLLLCLLAPLGALIMSLVVYLVGMELGFIVNSLIHVGFYVLLTYSKRLKKLGIVI